MLFRSTTVKKRPQSASSLGKKKVEKEKEKKDNKKYFEDSHNSEIRLPKIGILPNNDNSRINSMENSVTEIDSILRGIRQQANGPALLF